MVARLNLHACSMRAPIHPYSRSNKNPCVGAGWLLAETAAAQLGCCSGATPVPESSNARCGGAARSHARVHHQTHTNFAAHA
eukprot:7536261-Lingulodinium_polyedra.AAC.1